MKNSVGVKVSSFHFLSLFALALIHPFQSHYLNLKRRQNKSALRIMKHLIPTHSHKLSKLFAFFQHSLLWVVLLRQVGRNLLNGWEMVQFFFGCKSRIKLFWEFKFHWRHSNGNSHFSMVKWRESLLISAHRSFLKIVTELSPAILSFGLLKPRF